MFHIKAKTKTLDGKTKTDIYSVEGSSKYEAYMTFVKQMESKNIVILMYAFKEA